MRPSMPQATTRSMWTFPETKKKETMSKTDIKDLVSTDRGISSSQLTKITTKAYYKPKRYPATLLLARNWQRMLQSTANPARCAVPTYNAHIWLPIPATDPHGHTPWTKLAIDIVGLLITTRRGHKYLLAIVDLATGKKIDAVLRQKPSSVFCNIWCATTTMEETSLPISPAWWWKHGYLPDKTAPYHLMNASMVP